MKNLLLVFAGLFLVVPVIQAQQAKAEVILFLSAKCPCVYNHKQPVHDLINQYGDEINFKAVFIRKQDDKEAQDQMAKSLGWDMEFIQDADGHYLETYQPSVYSDAVLLNDKGEVIYRGGIDDGPLNSGWIKNFYLKNAIDDYRKGEPVRVKEAKGIGCLIM